MSVLKFYDLATHVQIAIILANAYTTRLQRLLIEIQNPWYYIYIHYKSISEVSLFYLAAYITTTCLLNLFGDRFRLSVVTYYYNQPSGTLGFSNIGLGLYLDGWPY